MNPIAIGLGFFFLGVAVGAAVVLRLHAFERQFGQAEREALRSENATLRAQRDEARTAASELQRILDQREAAAQQPAPAPVPAADPEPVPAFFAKKVGRC